jgi:DNA mismatch repair protein MutS2
VQVTQVAGTPSSFSRVAASQTLAELEFDRVLGVVAQHAVSDLGAAAVRARQPLADVEFVREELATAWELARELHERGRFQPLAVPDLTEMLEQLAIDGSVLDGTQLHALQSGLAAMREVASQLAALDEDAPRVAALAVEIPPRRLEQAIERAIEPDGRVKDGASPALKRARRRLRDARERLVTMLQGQLRDLSPREGEAEVTLRGGRYVIPVRAERRGRVKGIVHGESSSGATLFVEPAEAVELGNDLNACEAEEARETLAVLRALTEETRPFTPQIEDGLGMCVAADDCYARARYALASEASLPRLSEAPAPPAIRQGLHPLLLAESGDAVPFDLVLEEAETTVLVSGPNAGGKTVLLKAVGLLSAVAQSGVIPPVGPETTLPVFRRIFTDIGDHQSIDASLSTFSAHVARLKAILEEADASSLVLLDELGGQGAGRRHPGRGEREPRVRPGDAGADVPSPQGQARSLLRPGHRAAHGAACRRARPCRRAHPGTGTHAGCHAGGAGAARGGAGPPGGRGRRYPGAAHPREQCGRVRAVRAGAAAHGHRGAGA